jgi:hypothetical protein
VGVVGMVPGRPTDSQVYCYDFIAGKLDVETITMMKKPRCGVKDKFEFEKDYPNSNRNRGTGIHSTDGGSALVDCNCQVLAKISARTLQPSVRYCTTLFSLSTKLPHAVICTFS